MPAARVWFLLGEEIVVVIVQVCEVILGTAVASKRGTVRELLEVVQATGDAFVAVGIESIEVE